MYLLGRLEFLSLGERRFNPTLAQQHSRLSRGIEKASVTLQ